MLTNKQTTNFKICKKIFLQFFKQKFFKHTILQTIFFTMLTNKQQTFLVYAVTPSLY